VEENPFQRKKFENRREWRYDTCRNARENFQNLKKMGAKFVRTTSTFRSELKEQFYDSLLL